MIYHKFYHNSNEGEQGSVVMKFTHTYIYTMICEAPVR